VANWALTNNVQNFLASAGQGQNKDATVAVTATPRPPIRSTTRSAACRKTRDLMVKCSRQDAAGTTSHQRFAFLTTDGGTIWP